MNTPLGRPRFLHVVGIRDLVVLACVAFVVIVGIREQEHRDAVTTDNRRGAALVAIAVCQQANVLVSASLANKTAEQRRQLLPMVTQYLDPLNRALVQLGFPPSCKAPAH